jgi:ankyrin repeat protein
MSFSDLPTELVRAIFEEIFHDGWANQDLDKTLSLRLVCSMYDEMFSYRIALTYDSEEFNAQVKQCGLGRIWISAECRKPWRRISDSLLAIILRQKVILPQESRSSGLVNKLRDTTNALNSTRGEDEEDSDSTDNESLEILCRIAVSNLASSRVWEIAGYDEEVLMLSPAAATGNVSLMKDLLRDGADVNVSDTIFGCPLNAAAIGGNEAAARLLIEKGANIEYVKSAECGTALCQAARYGQGGVVRLLLEKGVKLYFDPLNRHALHYAMANGGHDAVVIALFEGGAYVNAKTGCGETVLHHAARIGVREAIIRLLLKQGANIESRDSQGYTPLCMAAVKKREDMVECLLARGANVQATDNAGRSILYHLVELKAPISLIHRFVNSGIQLDAKDEEGYSALHCAVILRQKEVVTLLLENGADFQVTTNNGTTPLHCAVDQFNVSESIVTLLLDSGADPNATTKDGTTTLHSASSRGNGNMVRLLLDHGANVKAKTANGITALHLATMESRPNVVGMLLKRGADPRARTTANYNGTCKGTTPLHCAARNPSIAEHLLKHGSEMEAKNEYGETGFFCAVLIRNTETVRLWAKFGVDINTTNNKGNTVLHKSSISSEMTATLLDLGVKVDTRNSAGETALHLAARGFNGVLKLLLDHGADVNALDASGRTALHWASSWINGHEASIQILVEKGADREIKDRCGDTALDLSRPLLCVDWLLSDTI